MIIDLSSISLEGVVVVISVLLTVSGLAIFFVQKKLRIKTKLFSLGQEAMNLSVKKNAENDVRLIIYSQVREYENWTGRIERLLCSAILGTFPDLSKQEVGCVRLVVEGIRHSLENQIFMDMVANHIVNLDEGELKKYTDNKTVSYMILIYNLIASYNDFFMPNIDLNTVAENINVAKLKESFFEIYTRSVLIAREKGVV